MNIEEFVNVFFSDQILFILLVVLTIILFILIIYLIKVEKSEKNKILDEIIPESDILEIQEEKESPLDLFESIIPDNDEESAIISADELLKVSQDLSEKYNADTSKIIDIYETEQEKKAIISYDELLKNAASLNIKYEEPAVKDMSEPVIKKIEVDINNSMKTEMESTNKVISYVEEEEFLKALKKFRLDLET